MLMMVDVDEFYFTDGRYSRC